MSVRRAPDSFQEAGHRLRQVAQLRRIWRAFRDPQERLEDNRLTRSLLGDAPDASRVQEPGPTCSRRAIRAVVRRWWCARNYAAIVEFCQHLDPALLDDEPLILIYLDEARAALAKTDPEG